MSNNGKKALRAHIRSLKAAHTHTELSLMSEAICNSVCSTVLWTEAHTVLMYHPLADEVDVRPLLHLALSQGKEVLLPVVCGNDLELRLYQGPSSLRVGAYGILEPTGPVFPPSRYPQVELGLIPGMAFDAQGHRLGRGKGYYDRLLPSLPSIYKLGVCFPFQLLPQIPFEVHDVVMGGVVSLHIAL